MTRLTYNVVLIPDGDYYVVHVPALPGCVTQGKTVDEALAMATEAISLWLHSEPVQPETTGVHMIAATVEVDVDITDGIVRSPGVIEAPRPSAITG